MPPSVVKIKSYGKGKRKKFTFATVLEYVWQSRNGHSVCPIKIMKRI